MKKAVTLKDIAKRLNMSISTVSKALSNDKSISEATLFRVKKQADEWNYIPNEAARHFKLNKTFTIGLIIPNMMDQYYVQAINGAENIAVQEKYNVIIAQSHENSGTEERILDLMKRNRVDGIIIAITKNTHDLTPFKKLKNIGIPVIFFARPIPDNDFDSVISDNADGAYKLTDFLIKRGHTRIAHLMAPKLMGIRSERFQGYKDALKKHNIDFDANLVKETNLTEKSTIKAMRQLMMMKNAPTGIFAFKNYVSLDAIEYLKKEFPQLLKKIDFVGFGNLPLFKYLDTKPVASIEENSYLIGKEAAKQLFKNINTVEPEYDVEIKIVSHLKTPCKLVIH